MKNANSGDTRGTLSFALDSATEVQQTEEAVRAIEPDQLSDDMLPGLARVHSPTLTPCRCWRS